MNLSNQKKIIILQNKFIIMKTVTKNGEKQMKKIKIYENIEVMNVLILLRCAI